MRVMSPPLDRARGDKSGALLYVSDTDSSSVYVYTYPGGKLKQTLTGLSVPGGECVDAKGDVFVANTGGLDVIEYAHGQSTPIATLNDPGYFPFGCDVDPTTGNLAVTNFSKSTSSGGGNIVVYTHARGKPRVYTDSAISGMLLCGYDAKGNLYVDGFSSGTPAYAVLPHGSKTFTNLTLNQKIGSPGGVQWDGKYVAIVDETTDTIYRFAISGSKGTSKGSAQLSGGSAIVQFWIDGALVSGANSGGGSVGIWKYPAGGSPIKTISKLYVPIGVTISK